MVAVGRINALVVVAAIGLAGPADGRVRQKDVLDADGRRVQSEGRADGKGVGKGQKRNRIHGNLVRSHTVLALARLVKQEGDGRLPNRRGIIGLAGKAAALGCLSAPRVAA